MHRDSLEILVRREREDHVVSLAVLDPVDPMESVYVFLLAVFFLVVLQVERLTWLTCGVSFRVALVLVVSLVLMEVLVAR